MKREDLILPTLLLLSVLTILIPLPGVVLDALLALNLLFAVLLFVGAFHLKDPLEITGLPSLLLLAALVRLSLNLATTRSILSSGHAGELVATFGTFVVGGNLVVGLVLFVLLTVVQFVVVAKGSERVAEVSARFTLDALPGKQMSIDADVRAGLIDAEGARKKRQDLQTESRFYGALDGAMKFVKGDAIAGMIITSVNLVGGFAIGVALKGMSFSTAVSTYSLLSIGDGLLSQLPSLLNAVAAGMLVTRVSGAESGSLSTQLSEQLGSLRGARVLASLLAGVLAFLPGMPYIILGLIALLGLLSALKPKQRDRTGESENSALIKEFDPALPAALSVVASVESLRPHYKELFSECQRLRSELYDSKGVLLDAIKIEPVSDGPETRRNDVAVNFYGIPVWQTSGGAWSVDDVVGALRETVTTSLNELVDDAMTRRLLDLVERRNPDIVATLIPAVLSTTQLTAVLRALVSEEVPINGIEAILQVAAEIGKCSERRIEMESRVRLRRAITGRIAPHDILQAHIVDPVVDLAVSSAEERSMVIPEAVYRALSGYADLTEGAIVLASKRARPYVRDVLRARGLNVTVIAHEELLPKVCVEALGRITLGIADSEEVLNALAA